METNFTISFLTFTKGIEPETFEKLKVIRLLGGQFIVWYYRSHGYLIMLMLMFGD